MAEARNVTTTVPENSSSPVRDEGEVGNFECNICLDLAQDPVITPCGHLYCWPCLYKWLQGHSNSHECPVCKAPVDEEKLIPLYGRGKTSTDQRSKPPPGIEIPNRPAGDLTRSHLQKQITCLILQLDEPADLYQLDQQQSATLECLLVLMDVVSYIQFPFSRVLKCKRIWWGIRVWLWIS
ncbi:UNVERIFIED_CONTAM: E3 ubiquitin-protein ligase RMA1H1 [Sesamum angustifolium]|uniref:E3 ubiquitin-protein ligase RMA n=1 Tax=Sesamum angustifolium TaxID=2727405 RepID=A0AAW2RKV6_9LAMI